MFYGRLKDKPGIKVLGFRGRWITAVALFAVGLVAATGAVEKRPAASKLMLGYIANQAKIYSSVKTSFEIRRKRFDKNLGRRDIRYSYETRYDGRRWFMRRRKWGSCYHPEDFIKREEAVVTNWLFNREKYGLRFIIYGFGRGGKKGSISLCSEVPKKDFKHRTGSADCWVRGFFGNVRVDDALKTAKHIEVVSKTETINGMKCYKVVADTRHGFYRLWIDPAHGYNIAKAMVKKRAGDIDYGRRLKKREVHKYFIENVMFKKTKDVWVVWEADTGAEFTDSKGLQMKTKSHYKRTGISIEPEFEQENFSIDAPEGLKVKIDNRKDGFSWRDGKVVDDAGRVVIDFSKDADESGETKR